MPIRSTHAPEICCHIIYLGKITILDNKFHCKCINIKTNVLFFIRILPSYGCWGNGWISWFPVLTVTSLILYCVIGYITIFTVLKLNVIEPFFSFSNMNE